MDDARRLKRGLKDVSRLFEAPVPVAPPDISASNSGIQCWSVYSPDFPEDGALLNAYVASRLDARVRSISLVSLLSAEPSYPGAAPQRPPAAALPAKRVSLSWAQFAELKGQVSKRSLRNSATQVLFLDCDWRHMPYFEKMIPMLDKWVLLVQPNLESLSESYKRIKASRGLNTRLEYYFISGCMPGDERAGALFEQFSELVARRLGVHLIWLGNLCFSKGTEPAGQMDLEHLFLRPMETLDSVEKMALAEFAFLPEPNARFA